MNNNIYWNQQAYYRPIPPGEVWLKNQTFLINGQFHTLRNRRGGGSFGSVWTSTMLNGHRAAVKVFDFRRLRYYVNRLALANSFEEEVRMTYQMRDAKYHVVNIYGFDFDLQRQLALVAMELGDDTLEDRVKKLHRMHPRYVGSGMSGDDYISAVERKNIWVQLVNIVLELYRHNIVHRDIKPANLVSFGPILKIIDLGLAQKERAGYNSQRLGGTYYFSAPECLNGGVPVTSKADIWSAGAVLYYLTYGTPPMYWTSQPPPAVPPTRSALIHDILYHCLQQNPYQRPWQLELALHPLTSSPAIA